MIHLGRGFQFIDWTVASDEATVRAGAAVPFKKLVYDAVERGFEGLEFGEGIPGSLGGGLTMNAGAFGGEIGRVVECLEGVHPEGRVEELSARTAGVPVPPARSTRRLGDHRRAAASCGGATARRSASG